MAAVIQPVCDSADPALPSTPRLYSVVRQPILDLHGRVHAYELLFRGVPAPDGVSAFNNLIEIARNFDLEKPQRVEEVDGKAHRICAAARWQALNEQLAQVLPATRSRSSRSGRPRKSRLK
jgi:EAL domain-containing protein (putative c-di-GMP-specific phosphodiesterase class I)